MRHDSHFVMNIAVGNAKAFKATLIVTLPGRSKRKKMKIGCIEASCDN